MTVRGKRLQLDFIAPNHDEFDKCRQMQKLGLSGRIGFRTSNGMIGHRQTIDGGAKLTTVEPSAETIRFRKWAPFDQEACSRTNRLDERQQISLRSAPAQRDQLVRR